MSRREHIQQLVAEGKLTPYEARILLEALCREESSPSAPLEGAGVTEPPPAPNPSPRCAEPAPSRRESATGSSPQSFQPLFVFIQEA